ncbi:serine-threonine dehydratase [Trypanosoma grayi]|uniref:serine-threonine dehydratase n=1 Tax=Trypanosoma grayi TaxID=71804 RepID=UPI0004F49FBA|nr:serine-threonine dehydratase [Trypanosoma grayi]KEG09805.1 serine-threonine dehydratase [Trypanosoma grayi]
MPTFRDVMTAYKAASTYVHETPIITSNALRQRSEHEEVVLKCENLQRTGCYNFRGVMNHIIRSKQVDIGINHFVTQSVSNHGLAVALAANEFASTGHIVIPANTPDIVVKSIKHYGGKVYPCCPSQDERMRIAQELVEANNNSGKNGVNSCVYVHPQDDWLIAGNGTAGVELMLQTDGRLDAVLVPAVGGTLLAGVAIAVKGMKPNIAVFAAECDKPDQMYEFEYGTVVAPGDNNNNNSSSSNVKVPGARAPYVRNLASELSTPLSPHVAQCVNRHVDGVLKVTEAQTRQAFRFIYERCKLVIDANAATAVAALITRPEALKRYRRIGIILTGGNVELDEVPQLARL